MWVNLIDNCLITNTEICPSNEKWCAVLGKDEKLALEAIYALHHQLDDDKNGNIDPFESDEVNNCTNINNTSTSFLNIINKLCTFYSDST